MDASPNPIPQNPPGVVWMPLPMQYYALQRKENEILYGGARGGGKSDLGIAWLTKHRSIQTYDPATGEATIRQRDPRILRKLRGLIIRKDSVDLSEWIQRARELYEPTGAKFTESPNLEIKWPDGHIIRGGHLHDANSFSKYKSHQYQQVVIEELTEIPDEKQFKKMLGCNRSTIPEIPRQVLCTTNPDGPGSVWVKKRYVKVRNTKGNIIAPMTTMLDPRTKITRVYIPAKLSENPYLMHNEDYKNVLLDQDEKTRRAWLDGDWDSMDGGYFTSFRPHGPLAGEEKYPWARHVIEPVELMPWWPRTIGVDWGFDHASAVYGGCHNQNDGRLHVYREFVQAGLGSEELGARIAEDYLPDLEGLEDHSIPMYLSHDCFSKDDSTRTKAEQIRDGIEKVLGRGSAFIVQLTEDEKRMGDTKQSWESMRRRYRALDGQMMITIHMASTRRVDGWQYMHGLMRFWPLAPTVKPDLDLARDILAREGRDAYQAYMDRYLRVPVEVLPKMVMHNVCPKLIDGLSSAVYDPDKPGDVLKYLGDDPIDAGRYLCMGYKSRTADKPMHVYLGERMMAAQMACRNYDDPLVRQQIAAKATQDYEKKITRVPFVNIGRAATRRFRLGAM